ncbi:hypothetical protein OKW45_002857 [Paraburkholderia sp. WSM4175]|uniref:hypothetical protein n=1 Tax=Paraburkholderia sp. WSM4175 TaxID=2991072 RepID=UPI003D223B98
MNLSMTLAPVQDRAMRLAAGGWNPRAVSPAKIKNRLFLSVIADRIAEVRHVLAESVHRVAAGKTEQEPGERAECEAAQ